MADTAKRAARMDVVKAIKPSLSVVSMPIQSAVESAALAQTQIATASAALPRTALVVGFSWMTSLSR